MTERTEKLIEELERIGYRVNGDSWDWNVSDADNGLTEVSDGQESAFVRGDWTATALECMDTETARSEFAISTIWKILNRQELAAKAEHPTEEMQYTVQTNDQSSNGCWTIYADDQGTIVGQYDSPDDCRGHLCDLGLTTVAMDVDGNGTTRQVPVEWIGDGEPLVGSPRALALI